MPQDEMMAKHSPVKFRGTVQELRALCWDWVRIDSKITRNVWDYDPAKRIWRRRTNRNGR